MAYSKSNAAANVKVIVSEYGKENVLRVVNEPLRAPAAGELRIRVQAAGVALADVMRREGVYPGAPQPPFTPGYDAVGTVDAVGEGVVGWAVGNKAAALFNDGTGGYASYAYVDSREALPVPEPLDAGEAVALLLNYVTAHQMLHRLAAVRPGDRVLVHAAAGGVGTALLELGRMAGLTMYGTASAAKHPIVAGYGAVPIDYRSEDFVAAMRQYAPEGVDAAFDPIGGEHVERSAGTLGPNGRLIQYGFTSILGKQDREALADQWRKPAQTLVAERQAAYRYSVTTWKQEHPDWFRDDVGRLFALLGQGRIKPLIADRLPLAEAASAQRLLESSAAIGKLILVP